MNVWLPLATLVLGYAGSLLTEAVRDRRAERRERLAREAEAATHRQRRDEDFQRETLLRIQDTAFDYAQTTTIHELTYMAAAARGERENPPRQVRWGREGNVPDEVGQLWQKAASQLILLRVRVADDTLRDLIGRWKDQTTQIILAPDEAAAHEASTRADVLYAEMNERIGSLLRERYREAARHSSGGGDSCLAR